MANLKVIQMVDGRYLYLDHENDDLVEQGLA